MFLRQGECVTDILLRHGYKSAYSRRIRDRKYQDEAVAPHSLTTERWVALQRNRNVPLKTRMLRIVDESKFLSVLTQKLTFVPLLTLLLQSECKNTVKSKSKTRRRMKGKLSFASYGLVAVT